LRLEVVGAICTALLALLTAFVPDWIEAVFRVDPDHGNGSLEIIIVIVFGLITLLLLYRARVSWHALQHQGS
jgi:hypothetical protein